MNCLFRSSRLSGTVQVPASKSVAHRAYICNALSASPVKILCDSDSDDLKATKRCLSALCNTSMVSSTCILDCGESGSTFRFLLPVACALRVSASFTGNAYLATRPISPLYEELAAHGITLSEKGHFPLTVSGALQPGQYTLPGNISSQFISGLLFALPLLSGDSVLTVTGKTESAAYITITLKMLETYGIRIEPSGSGYHIPGAQTYHAPNCLQIEGDWSNAAFWLASGVICDTAPWCKGLNYDSVQGDRAVLNALEAFGAKIEYSENGIRALSSSLHGTTINASEIPDLIPILAVVASQAEGKTMFINAGRLRLKESDRITSVEALLQKLGIHTESTEDSLTVYGGHFISDTMNNPVTISSCNDHRIAMAAAIAALKSPVPVLLTGAEAVRKSYPTFYQSYTMLGGLVQ